MGDNDRTTLSNDPAANAPDAAAVDKGKGKAVDTTRDYEMGGDDVESSEDESAEEMAGDDDEEDEHDNLEPISQSNIIPSGRRTRGKTIDFAEAAQKADAEGDAMDDSEDDEDFVEPEEDEDEQMRG